MSVTQATGRAQRPTEQHFLARCTTKRSSMAMIKEVNHKAKVKINPRVVVQV